MDLQSDKLWRNTRCRNIITESVNYARQKHITQVRLSTELGVAQETISAYEQGRHLPSVSSLMKLSSILDASMDYIMMKSDVRNMIQVQSLSDNETRLLGYYKKLNASGKEKALSYIEGLNDGLRSGCK